MSCIPVEYWQHSTPSFGLSEEEHDGLHESEDGDEDDNEAADLNDDEWELPSAATRKPSSDGQAAPAGGASSSLYKDDERSAVCR